MATKKISKESVKKVASNVKNNALKALCWTGKALKAIGEIIIIVIAAFFYGIVTLLGFNPLVMFFWALIAPKYVANKLFEQAHEESPFSIWGDFLVALNVPIMAILPWYAKKAFMIKKGLSRYSVKQQVRFFQEASAKDKLLILQNREICSEAQSILWENKDYRILFVEKKYPINQEQFRRLLEDKQLDVIEKYIKKNTPSEMKVAALLKYAAADDGQEYWFILRYSIERDGLSSYLIGLVYSDYFSLASRMSQALEIFAQRQMIIGCSGDNDSRVLWTKFCEQTAEIFEEVQVYMNVWQYDFFHKAGKELSEYAIAYFLEKGNDEMVKRIFGYEPDNGVCNDLIVTLVNANPKYLNWLLNCR